MKGSRFTESETILCTYAAMYDADDFGGCEVIINYSATLGGRPATSITAKIRNIAGTLDRFGVPRNTLITALTGTAPGESARKTDWDRVIRSLTLLSQESLLGECGTILESQRRL